MREAKLELARERARPPPLLGPLLKGEETQTRGSLMAGRKAKRGKELEGNQRGRSCLPKGRRAVKDTAWVRHLHEETSCP